MGQRRCTAEDAFDLLIEVSQDTNRKLREVAQALVDQSTGRDGTSNDLASSNR
jgi:AmiR/NasT family two-component response regulator